MLITWIRGAVASALVGTLGWSAHGQEPAVVLPAPGLVEPVGGTAAAASLSKEQVRAIVAEYVKEQADKKSASEADAKKKEADQGTVVGADLSMKARWNHGVWFETADKAFKFHLGGRVQFDVVGAGANDSVLFGTGGFTRYEDAVNFRRARLTADGTIWENYNFTLEFDFLNTFDSGVVTNATGNRNNVEDVPVPTDLWIEATQIPIFGNFRVGNQKPPISFEHFTSSRFLNFLERSYGFDAFVEDGNNGFAPGLMLYNWTENQNATWALNDRARLCS